MNGIRTNSPEVGTESIHGETPLNDRTQAQASRPGVRTAVLSAGTLRPVIDTLDFATHPERLPKFSSRLQFQKYLLSLEWEEVGEVLHWLAENERRRTYERVDCWTFDQYLRDHLSCTPEDLDDLRCVYRDVTAHFGGSPSMKFVREFALLPRRRRWAQELGEDLLFGVARGFVSVRSAVAAIRGALHDAKARRRSDWPRWRYRTTNGVVWEMRDDGERSYRKVDG